MAEIIQETVTTERDNFGVVSEVGKRVATASQTAWYCGTTESVKWRKRDVMTKGRIAS